jgi:hypothetical protein
VKSWIPWLILAASIGILFDAIVLALRCEFVERCDVKDGISTCVVRRACE